jgi:fructose-1,6-bisphosphatase/inositol monophosphatase family enzyme
MANIADEIGLHYFEKAKNMTLSVEDKDNKTPVSEGDLAIEKEIRRILGTDYPGLAIL